MLQRIHEGSSLIVSTAQMKKPVKISNTVMLSPPFLFAYRHTGARGKINGRGKDTGSVAGYVHLGLRTIEFTEKTVTVNGKEREDMTIDEQYGWINGQNIKDGNGSIFEWKRTAGMTMKC